MNDHYIIRQSVLFVLFVVGAWIFADNLDATEAKLAVFLVVTNAINDKLTHRKPKE